MPVSFIPLEQTLLETSAGRSVFDALVQANLDIRSIPATTVERMLSAEKRRQIEIGGFRADDEFGVC